MLPRFVQAPVPRARLFFSSFLNSNTLAVAGSFISSPLSRLSALPFLEPHQQFRESLDEPVLAHGGQVAKVLRDESVVRFEAAFYGFEKSGRAAEGSDREF